MQDKGRHFVHEESKAQRNNFPYSSAMSHYRRIIPQRQSDVDHLNPWITKNLIVAAVGTTTPSVQGELQ